MYNRLSEVLTCFLFLFFSTINYAQDSIDVSVKPYISLRGQLAVFDKDTELQDNVSRTGIELKIKNKSISFIAGLEFQINMFKGNSSFNVDGNLDNGLLAIKSETKQQVLGNRLGYLGIDFNQYGKLTFGKQWGVYRDVTAYTDKFNVFGGRASATFTGGTDGGELGTGRADQAIIYRNKIKFLHIGTQVQTKGGNSNLIDGFGLSAQVELTKELLVGIAYNKAFINKALIDNKILGLNGNPSYFTLGSNYSSKKFDFSLVGIIQENGDFTSSNNLTENNIIPSYVFGAKGFESYFKWKMEKLALSTGYNLYVPNGINKDNSQYVSDKFRKSDWIVGINYSPIKFIQIYSEQRFSFGHNSSGQKEQNIFVLGMRMDLSKQFNQSIKL